jgi:hypothetical protein
VAELWTPGMAGPADELVGRIHRRIQSFAEEHGLERAMVEAELSDGSLLRLQSLSAQPGFGFVTLVPHAADGDPEEVIAPLGTIRQLRLRRAEGESPFGFSLPLE